MTYALKAIKRTDLGRQAKKVFVSGEIPAVIYGNGIEPRAVKVFKNDFRKIFREAGSSSLVDLAIEGESSVKVLIQDVQVNPISMDPAHIDFRQIRMDEEIEVEVPLVFVGEAKAVKELLGTLVTSIDTMRVKCLPGDLPHEIEVDLSSLNSFEDVITIKSLNIPKGVKVMDDPESVLANVSRPLSEEELKKMDEVSTGDVTAIKTEAEEKKAEEEAKKAEETANKE